MVITIKIPQEEEDKFIEWQCELHNYEETVFDKADPKPNPEKPQQFIKRKMAEGVMYDFALWKKRKAVITSNITVE